VIDADEVPFADLPEHEQLEELRWQADWNEWTRPDQFPDFVPAWMAGQVATERLRATGSRPQRSTPEPTYNARTGEVTPPAAPLLAGADVMGRYAPARITWADDFWNPPETGDEWLIGPVIARGRGHAVYAAAKAGKSLFVLAIVAAAATGRAVLARPAGDPVRTLYLDCEMTPDDLRERLGDMGYGPGDDLEPLAYYSLPSLPPLDTPEGGAHVTELAREHRADLVVIDTLSRVIGGPENEADTIRALYRFTGAPLKAAGIATLRIDHAGKDAERGERGSSAKRDDLDVIWRLTSRDRGCFELRATPPPRMGWVPALVNLEQTTDPLGYRLVDDAWPAGTAEAAATLDRLGVPLDHGKERARQAIRAAGETAPRSATLMAALRFRRLEADRLVTEITP
jgi:hypothetical protein